MGGVGGGWVVRNENKRDGGALAPSLPLPTVPHTPLVLLPILVVKVCGRADVRPLLAEAGVVPPRRERGRADRGLAHAIVPRPQADPGVARADVDAAVVGDGDGEGAADDLWVGEGVGRWENVPRAARARGPPPSPVSLPPTRSTTTNSPGTCGAPRHARVWRGCRPCACPA